MYKVLTGFIFSISLVANIFAQTNWQRYSWGTPDREGFTVLLPFVPRQIGDERSSAGWQGIMADSAGSKPFQLADENAPWSVNSQEKLVSYSIFFMDGVSQAAFDKQVKDRMDFIGSGDKGNGVGTPRAEIEREINLNHQTTEVSVCGYTGVRFGNSTSVQQFFLINNRLYRLSVRGLDRSDPDAIKFLESFALINPWRLWKGKRVNEKYEYPGTGSGDLFESSVCRKIGTSKIKNEIITQKIEKKPANSNLIILSRPRAAYPEESKKKQIQGIITLKVTFLKDGAIGEVSVIKGINQEMDESAVKAAKLIKFEPPRKNGRSVSITKRIEYSFTLY